VARGAARVQLSLNIRSRPSTRKNMRLQHSRAFYLLRVQPSLIIAVGPQTQKNEDAQHSCGLCCATLRVFSLDTRGRLLNAKKMRRSNIHAVPAALRVFSQPESTQSAFNAKI
jgi:hypothetical protein